jgi:asparagine synthase (glutamine-hydrolysing)
VSGFAGIVRIAGDSASLEMDRDAISRMAEAIAFRGPDALQRSELPGAMFSFSLLRTGPAPQASKQPCTVDGETWLVGDVRCDGRREILTRLAQHGGEISPEATSEELLLQSYAKFAEAGLAEIAGDLSFALWNARDRTLAAFRDLTGARPFFYAESGRALIFSNTLQAMLAVPSVSRDLDLVYLGDFLLGAPYFDQASSVYQKIRRLPPGHFLEFSVRGLQTRRVANMPIEEPLARPSPNEYVEEFRRLFAQAVSDRLPEIDTTILLSGGLDSTSIAATAVAIRKKASTGLDLKLHAYSIDSQPLYQDQETHLASKFAASLAIPCEVFHSGHVLPFNDVDGRGTALAEPSFDPYAQFYNFYFRQVCKNSRVVFSGGGGDEVLRLQALAYLRYLRKKLGLAAVLGTLLRYTIKQRELPPIGTGMLAGMQASLGKKFYSPQFPPWFTAEFSRLIDLPSRWQAINAPAAVVHPSNPVAYSAVNDGSIAEVLETYDASWTNCALEVRSPFMDRRLTRFLLRVPAIPWAMNKQLLRAAQFGVLPDEIRLRKKCPLQGDDLLLQIAAGNWNPVPDDRPADPIRSLVDWPRLRQDLHRTPDISLHLHLRPVALALWLKGIENSNVIQ